MLLALAVVASGCAHPASLESKGSKATKLSPSKGLVVKKFTASDSELGPRQQGIISLSLRNYHSRDIKIEDISLYNTAFLEVKKQQCTPDAIRSFRAGKPGRMECSWTVKVPESSVEGFRDKVVPLKLNLAYQSQLGNQKNPLKLKYMPVQQIEKTTEISRTYSNNELELKLKTEKPAPSQGRILEFGIRNVGKGRVEGKIEIDYRPKNLFNCPNSQELIQGKTSFSCETSFKTSSPTTRNLIFSVSYKYVKAPTLDIRVVSQ